MNSIKQKLFQDYSNKSGKSINELIKIYGECEKSVRSKYSYLDNAEIIKMIWKLFEKTVSSYNDWHHTATDCIKNSQEEIENLTKMYNK